MLNINTRENSKPKYHIHICKNNSDIYKFITNLFIDNGNESVLQLLLDGYTTIGTEVGIIFPPGSGLTRKYLYYFSIDFEDAFQLSDICALSTMNDQANQLIKENKDTCGQLKMPVPED